MILLTGLRGAILAMLISQVANVWIGVVVLKRHSLLDNLNVLQRLPEKMIIKNLLRFVGPMITVKIAKDVGSLLLRSGIIKQLGIEDNGIFEVLWGMSLTYMGLFTSVAFYYGMPKAAASLADPKKMTSVQNDALRIGLLLVIPLTIGLIGLREIWIPLLYSPVFLPAAPFLAWHFAGDILRVARVSVNISILPLERFGYAIFDGVFSWGAWSILSLVLMPRMGLFAVPTTYLLINLIGLIIAYVYHTARTQYRLDSKNSTLIKKAVPMTLIAFLLAHGIESGYLRILVTVILVAVTLLVLPHREDYGYLLRRVKQIFTKFAWSRDSNGGSLE
jgi:hypothetical protein